MFLLRRGLFVEREREIRAFIPEEYCVGDYVWEDSDGDGIQDDNEDGLPGVTVQVYTCDGNVGNDPDAGSGTLVGEDITDATGYYEVCDLPVGDYYVVFEKPDGYEASPRDQSGDDTIDSDGGEGCSECECNYRW